MSFSYRRALKSPTAGLLGKSNRDNGRERGPWDKRLGEGVAGTRISLQTLQEGCCSAQGLLQVLSALYKGHGSPLCRHLPCLEESKELILPNAAGNSPRVL